jgi:hypothetical protein
MQTIKRSKNRIIIIKEILTVLCPENQKEKVKAIKISITPQSCNKDKVELRKLCKLILKKDGYKVGSNQLQPKVSLIKKEQLEQ